MANLTLADVAQHFHFPRLTSNDDEAPTDNTNICMHLSCLVHKPKHNDYQHPSCQSQEQTTKLHVGLTAVMQNVTHEKWICLLTHQNAVFFTLF